jgi:two-component system LytT family response regulator
MLRTLIVDDEALAIERLQILCSRIPSVSLVGTATDGESALRLIEALAPDLLLLDIQMPKLDGFDVLDLIGPETPVVFVTAYDAYAVRAFDVHAVDYVLKPIDEARFAAAVERARERALARREGATDTRLRALVDDHARHARRFLVRARDRTVVVDVDQIEWIEAADYYATLHVAGGKAHLLRETLNELEQRLDPAKFFRVHRSAIVSLERVREIHPLFRGDCELVLRDGTHVRLSRTRRREFQRVFAGPSAAR